ncbi:hypothetical protein POJ06DRAFT_298151 [Lipomyces tetrasporus]|uniref:Uncharacterized protein n=1 Tax=Lipomyces tetrasporus TaxID=54092 RepID=A0AAD7R0Y0_9ASCO|nr:uncharacterized protein POJ06DRAFT_298151 [Lipomyces tetrasporus]KAJ8103697.1 hypothetical protein POJ06DRAFT_298151 [Lipomyces tetrasporus]
MTMSGGMDGERGVDYGRGAETLISMMTSLTTIHVYIYTNDTSNRGDKTTQNSPARPPMPPNEANHSAISEHSNHKIRAHDLVKWSHGRAANQIGQESGEWPAPHQPNSRINQSPVTRKAG